MTTTAINTPEYRDVPLALLVPSTTNPRRRFDEAFLRELAASIQANGVLTPLLVRPKDEHLEIVFGEQRYRAAQIADAATIPVRIREMSDAQVLEAQLIELSIVVKRFLPILWSCTSWISPRRADFVLILVTVSQGYNRMPEETRDNGWGLDEGVHRPGNRQFTAEPVDGCTRTTYWDHYR